MKKKDTVLIEGGLSSLFTAVNSLVDKVQTGVSAAKSQANKVYKDNPGNSSYLNGSISNYSKDLIMSFPMMCDNSLSPSTASMISRANERNIVTMLELLFASMNLHGNSGREILATIHKNIKVGYSLDDAIDDINGWVNSEGVAESVTNQQIATAVRTMLEQLRLGSKSFPVESLSERSLNDFVVLNMNGRTVVKEDNSSTSVPVDTTTKQTDVSGNGYQFNDFQRMLLDSDVKKANELQPTLMVVKINQINPDNKTYAGSTSFIAGVKSRLVSVEPIDIVERLMAKKKTELNFLNFIRATTGEISLVRDLLLCIDQAKLDSKNEVKKGASAKMWRVLENRGIKNNSNKIKRAGNDASAITTLVINQETVNLMKKQYGFDMENVKNAKMIMDVYNLLGIIIADESIEVVKTLYAGNDVYEQQAYSFIEKESNDNSYKKVINLLGKANGGR